MRDVDALFGLEIYDEGLPNVQSHLKQTEADLRACGPL